MGLYGKVCLLQLFHADIGHHSLRIEDVNLWVCSISLPIILVAWAEVSYNYFDAPKIQIIMSSSVNPIFLKPNSCNCASHRFSTIQEGAIYVMATVWSSCSQLFPSGNSYNIYKTTQKCVIDTERFCNSIVLITNCLRLFFCDSGRPGRLDLLQTRVKRHRWVLGGAEFWSVSVGSGFIFVTLIFKATTHTFVRLG